MQKYRHILFLALFAAISIAVIPLYNQLCRYQFNFLTDIFFANDLHLTSAARTYLLIFGDSADTILGNCDTTLFLGGKEKTTLKEMSELLGKETIDLYNTSETRSNQKSFGLNYQKTGKQLMTEDEIAVMDGGKCILQIRGARPFFSDKYDITKHKNYRLLADENEKNRYKVEKELNPQYTPKSEEEVEVIHVELSE